MLRAVSLCAGSLSEALDVNISGDYTRDRSEPAGTVLIAAGRPGPTASNPNPFNPAIPNAATNANGGAWLTGRNGLPVPVDCRVRSRRTI